MPQARYYTAAPKGEGVTKGAGCAVLEELVVVAAAAGFLGRH